MLKDSTFPKISLLLVFFSILRQYINFYSVMVAKVVLFNLYSDHYRIFYDLIKFIYRCIGMLLYEKF